MGVLSWVEGRPHSLRCMSCLPLEESKRPFTANLFSASTPHHLEKMGHRKCIEKSLVSQQYELIMWHIIPSHSLNLWLNYLFSQGDQHVSSFKRKRKKKKNTIQVFLVFSFWATEKHTTYFMYLARKSGRKPEGEVRIRHFHTQL